MDFPPAAVAGRPEFRKKALKKNKINLRIKRHSCFWRRGLRPKGCQIRAVAVALGSG